MPAVRLSVGVFDAEKSVCQVKLPRRDVEELPLSGNVSGFLSASDAEGIMTGEVAILLLSWTIQGEGQR